MRRFQICQFIRRIILRGHVMINAFSDLTRDYGRVCLAWHNRARAAMPRWRAARHPSTVCAIAFLGAVLFVGPAEVRAEPADPATVQKGEYLARAGDCTSCHTAAGGQPFAGGLKMDTPFGFMLTPNITPDDETGIGLWSADDFYRALHNGVNKKGQDLYPVMPYTFYTKVTRADSDAIFAYLRSQTPVRNDVDVNNLNFPFDIRLTQLFWRELFFTEGTFAPDQGKTEQWNRGAYLVEGLGHCSACHSPRNILGGIEKGEQFTGARVDHWFALNLTSNLRTGIGAWSDLDMIDYLRKGAAKRESTALGPMAEVVHNSLSYLTDADILAIAIYLKSLPAKTSPDASAPVAPDRSKKAAELYVTNCGVCHQAKGAGVAGVFPRLAGNPVVLAPDPANVLSVVLAGVPQRNGYMPMPSFAPTLNDKEIAAIVNYVRTNWGNTEPGLIAPETVEQFRKTIGAKPAAAAPEVSTSKAPVAAPATNAAVSDAAHAAPEVPATKPSIAAPAVAAPPMLKASGWYTADQAHAGGVLFQSDCAACHGAKLAGGMGPPLAGEAFLANWGTHTLADLSAFEHKQMPLTAPGSLSNQDYTDITAFILQENGFPAGATKLTAGSELSRKLQPSAAARDAQH
jgi:mono/diheme cytochrome c family protein